MMISKIIHMLHNKITKPEIALDFIFLTKGHYTNSEIKHFYENPLQKM